ncbi:hypothetical protein N7486_006916 [Penicillium sp. IBT 16267x]|nr:hypothetical protein N7486_006916 [Penicillium sp. IBT 16267x]
MWTSTLPSIDVVLNVGVTCHAAILARRRAVPAQKKLKAKINSTMGSVSKRVDESKAHVHTIALLPATATKSVLHAQPNVMSPAATHNAQSSASSPAPLVRKSTVFPYAHIASAPCPAPHHVIMFLVLVGARSLSSADIDVLLCVERSVHPHPTARFCGHFLTMESMDAQMDLKKHYDVDTDGKPIALLVSSQPFSIEDMKTCGICRGHLRNIARYGRLVRRALLDESTKKLILRLNQEFVPLAQELTREIRKLQETDLPEMTRWPEVEIKGRSIEQLKVMKNFINSTKPQRWDKMIELRARIMKYLQDVNPEEQPFQRVRDMVINAQRRKKTTGDFKFGDEILQTKGVLQGAALSIRLDIALLSDFLALAKLASYKEAPLKIDLESLRNDCRHLTQEATASERRVHELEGFIFEAELYAMERAYVSEELGESHLQNGLVCIDKARRLCAEYSGQTSGLASEVDNAEKMLQGGTFYAGISSEERMAIISVMAQDFTGTGHWYYCRNNHPFTIGECGGAVELASCPECGAQIGGREHVPARGVVRAEDFDMDLARLAR